MKKERYYNLILLDFLRFLIKKDLYIPFTCYWSKVSYNRPLRGNLKYALDFHNAKCTDFFGCMCSWSATIEGFDFWNNIATEWESIYLNNIKTKYKYFR